MPSSLLLPLLSVVPASSTSLSQDVVVVLNSCKNGTQAPCLDRCVTCAHARLKNVTEAVGLVAIRGGLACKSCKQTVHRLVHLHLPSSPTASVMAHNAVAASSIQASCGATVPVSYVTGMPGCRAKVVSRTTMPELSLGAGSSRSFAALCIHSQAPMLLPQGTTPALSKVCTSGCDVSQACNSLAVSSKAKRGSTTSQCRV